MRIVLAHLCNEFKTSDHLNEDDDDGQYYSAIFEEMFVSDVVESMDSTSHLNDDPETIKIKMLSIQVDFNQFSTFCRVPTLTMEPKVQLLETES